MHPPDHAAPPPSAHAHHHQHHHPATKKRERDPVDDAPPLPSATAASTPEPVAGAPHPSTSNFRNVSACNRCRSRKNRCDQKLPACSGCAKAGVRCVGYDPVSKRTIPRSYVFYLETRVGKLEALLRERGVPFEAPEEDFEVVAGAGGGGGGGDASATMDVNGGRGKDVATAAAGRGDGAMMLDPALAERDERESLNRLVDDVGMVSVQGTSESRYLGSTSGISFARVVFAAVKSSVGQGQAGERRASRGGSRPTSGDAASGGGTGSMRDSFFGLHTKPSIKPAPFPDKKLGQMLVDVYFEHANPQLPVLHRGEFMSLFERVYWTDAKKRTPRELYLLNIVFAIGSGISLGCAYGTDGNGRNESTNESDAPNKKRQRLTGHQHQPEEYHSSAVVHLESFLGSSPAADGGAGGLEELQAVLLLAGLALLRPVAPGLWYIVGVAARLAVDLGLHSEDVDHQLENTVFHGKQEEQRYMGRKQWTREIRRRLWWCTYSFDRLVSISVGRPFGITDQVVTTEFPSAIDDKYITPSGFLKPPSDTDLPSYKLVCHHYLRHRLLQSEILQVLQYRQAEQARALGANSNNSYIHKNLPSPFLQRFATFRDWRHDVDRRLWYWKETAPKQAETGVAFNPLFYELNYWQTVIMLYRQSLAVPEPLAGDLNHDTGNDVQSPGAVNFESKEDEQMVFMKVAQAGQTTLKIYRQLHRLKLVNYTFLATHYLFMSGISFLYAIWHSPLVRSQLTLDDVDFTVLVGTSVLTDLIAKCPPAEACRDAFVRMSKATISMCEATTGFGDASTLASQPLNSPDGTFDPTLQTPRSDETMESVSMPPPSRNRMHLPKFDMNLKDLFSDEEIASSDRVGPSIFSSASLRQHDRTPPSYAIPQSPQSSAGAMSQQQSKISPDSTRSYFADPSNQHRLPHRQQTYDPTLTSQQPPPPFPSDLSWLDASFPQGPSQDNSNNNPSAAASETDSWNPAANRNQPWSMPGLTFAPSSTSNANPAGPPQDSEPEFWDEYGLGFGVSGGSWGDSGGGGAGASSADGFGGAGTAGPVDMLGGFFFGEGPY